MTRSLAAGLDRLPGSHRDLSRRFASLPAHHQTRLATAPSIYRQLSESKRSPEETARVLADGIAAEECLCGAGRPDGGAVWTALGDYALTAAPDGQPCIIASPVCELGIPVDFCSPSCPYQSPLQTDRMIPELSRVPVRTAIDAACRLLTTTSRRAADLVATATRVVCARLRGDGRPGFSSSSWSNEIGKCALSYPPSLRIDTTLIASCLVHESVHALLYVIERHIPTYRADALIARVRSPWTGRELPVSSATHACFVWFAIRSLWSKGETGTTKERDFAGAGFRADRWRGFYDALRGGLMPDTAWAIAELQRRCQ